MCAYLPAMNARERSASLHDTMTILRHHSPLVVNGDHGQTAGLWHILVTIVARRSCAGTPRMYTGR